MRTVTSQLAEKELFELTKETIRDVGDNGGLLMNDTDLFLVEDEKLYLIETKERGEVHHEVSRTEFDSNMIYSLFDLFENVTYNHYLQTKEI